MIRARVSWGFDLRSGTTTRCLDSIVTSDDFNDSSVRNCQAPPARTAPTLPPLSPKPWPDLRFGRHQQFAKAEQEYRDTERHNEIKAAEDHQCRQQVFPFDLRQRDQ